nr:MAG: putative capsid protein [Arizlama virus]
MFRRRFRRRSLRRRPGRRPMGRRAHRRSYRKNRACNGFPRSRFVKLTYADFWTLASGAGASHAFNNFKINSLYDPDDSGVGGQPSLFDQWAAFFNRYKVYGVRVSAHFTAVTDTNMLVGIYGGGPGGEYPGTGVGWQQTLLEAPRSRCVSRNLAPKNQGTGTTCHLSKYFSVKSLLGSASFNDMSASAITNANPANVAYGVVAVVNADGATATNTVNVALRITAYVRFSEPKFTFED